MNVSDKIIPGLVIDKSPIGIKQKIKEYFNVDLTAKSNKPEFVLPRQIAIYLIKHFHGLNKPGIHNKSRKIIGNTKLLNTEIGALFGKDHSTVTDSVKKVQNYIDVDVKFRNKYRELFEYFSLEIDSLVKKE